MEQREAEGQGARDVATLLPVVTAILLLPPIVLIFSVPRLVAGIPMIVVYFFGVWFLAVIAALLTARRLPRQRTQGRRHQDQE